MTPGSHGSLPYAQVRMQARVGRRPGEPDLQRMRAASDLSACLQQVRGSALSRHAGRLAPGMGPHELDRRLRAEWRSTVDEVARWLPGDWQPALQWLGWLPWLPALQKLARGGRPAGWMRDDPVLARIVAATLLPAAASRLSTAPLQPLVNAVAARTDVPAAWLAHWRKLWPAGVDHRRGLTRIVAAVQGTMDVLAAAEAATATADALDTLRRTLLREFRRSSLSPPAAVAYLGLEALDLMELRGAVTRRAALAAEAA